MILHAVATFTTHWLPATIHTFLGEHLLSAPFLTSHRLRNLTSEERYAEGSYLQAKLNFVRRSTWTPGPFINSVS